MEAEGKVPWWHRTVPTNLVPLDTESSSSSSSFSVSPSAAACPAPWLDPATSQPSPALHKCLMGCPGSLISPWGSSRRDTFFLKISCNSQCYCEVNFNIHPINLPLQPFCLQTRITHYYESGNKNCQKQMASPSPRQSSFSEHCVFIR